MLAIIIHNLIKFEIKLSTLMALIFFVEVCFYLKNSVA